MNAMRSHIQAGIALLTVSALLISMLLSTTVLPAKAAIFGDVNDDGQIDIFDAMGLYMYTSGETELTAAQLTVCDVTDDGETDIFDAMMLYMVASGSATLPETEEQPPQDGANEQQGVLTPIDPANYYGRTLLAQENELYVEVYDYLGEQLALMESDIDIRRFGITVPVFEKILQYYRDDHPEVFWMNSAYTYYYDWSEDGEMMISTFCQDYLCTADEVADYQQQLEDRTQQLLKGITDDMPYSEREKLVHDRLVLSSEYDMTLSAEHTHDLIGVMLNGLGVCESYSRAFQYLMYRCGIQTILVIGQPNTGAAHMWNAVELGGDWYHVDVTWNDPVFPEPMPDYIGYTYYDVTTAYLMEERVIFYEYSSVDADFQTSYPIPECTATKENLELKYAVKLSRFDIDVMAPVFADSIINNGHAIFRPGDGYTLDQFHTDFANGDNFWALIYAVNGNLNDDIQLTTPGYSIKENSMYGFVSIYLRQM